MTTKQKVAKEIIAEIKKSESIADLKAIFNDDIRKSVIAAYEARLDTLSRAVEDPKSEIEEDIIKEKSKPNTKVMALFFKRASETSWLKIGEGEGGSIADVHMNYFSYPLSQTKTGSIIFDDGSILDCMKREFRSQKDLELVKSLIKTIK